MGAIMELLNNLIDNPMHTLISLAITVTVVLVSLAVHECMHAYVAWKMGDDTAFLMGRVTLNPFAHVDPLGVLMLVFFRFGWGKPVMINQHKLRNPRWGMIASTAAGPLSNLVMAFIGALCLGLQVRFAPPASLPQVYLNQLFATFFVYNVALLTLNLLPLPPLDGYRIIKLLFSTPSNVKVWWNVEKYSIMLLFGLSFVGALSLVLTPLQSGVIDGMIQLMEWIRLPIA